MPFIAIRELRELVKSSFHVTSRADLDILIDLAAATQLGQGLTMKQLVILHSGSATTTRRRITKLIADGKVVKIPHGSDGRSEVYGISRALWELSADLRAAMHSMCAEFGTRTQPSGMPAKKSAQNIR